MKNTKRIIATVLTAVMMISMLPSSVFAAELDAYDVVEPAVEAVSVPAEEQEIESTVEDISVEDAEEVQGSSEEIETVDAADPEAADVIEDTEAPVVTEEKTTIEAEGKDYVVTVTYDAAALLPDDVKVSVKEIFESAKKYDDYCDQALEAVQQENADVEELSYTRLFDIKLVDADGNPLEPASAVDVQIRLKDVETVEENTQIVHFAGEEETPEVIEPTVDNDTVTFATDGFSIYAVVTTGNYARLTVNFNVSEGNTTTMYVKKQDITDGNLNQVLYDPGVPVVERKKFMGWTDVENDQTLSAGMTIDQVRSAVAARLNAGITDGDSVTYYAKMVTSFELYYQDEFENTYRTENLLTAGDSATTTVNQNYTIQGQAATKGFVGWVVKGTEEPVYKNGSQITISADTTLVPKIGEGKWIHFDENDGGSGTGNATYTAPRFVPAGENASAYKPDNPTRPGYTFAGWYKGAADSAEKYEFNTNLSEFTGTEVTLYAHWTPNTHASYKVIIWKQKVTDDKNAADADKTYDYLESHTVEEVATDTPITADTLSQYLSYGNAELGVTDLEHGSYGFKTPARFVIENGSGADKNGVSADNSTIVNVYYDRALFSIRFTGTSGGSISYIPTDNGSNVYGQVNGEYVPLTTTVSNKRIVWTRYSGTLEVPESFTQVLYSSKTKSSSLLYSDQLANVSGLYYYGSKLIDQEVGTTATQASIGNSSTRYYLYTTESEQFGNYCQLRWTIAGDYSYTYNGEPYTGQLYKQTSEIVYTGLYGQSFKDADPSYEWVMPDSTHHWEHVSYLDAFTGNLYGHTNVGGTPNTIAIEKSDDTSNIITLVIWEQNTDLSGYTKAASAMYSCVSTDGFNITERVQGMTPSGYRWSTSESMPETWNSAATMSSSTDGVNTEGYTNVKRGSNTVLHVKNDRVKNDIVFMNGSDEVGRTEDIAYGVSLVGYRNTTPDASEINIPENQYFAGWYDNPEGVGETYDWSETMPLGNKLIYAVTKPVQYHVVVEMDGGEVPGQQRLSFWVPYGTVLDDTNFMNATKEEAGSFYSLVGYYTDEAYTKLWNFTSRITAESLWHPYTGPDDPVRAEYDDAGYDQTVGIFKLFARWRNDDILSKGGHHIRYKNPTGAPTYEYTDPLHYADLADVITAQAPTENDWPEGKRFDGWQLTEGKVYQPGDIFVADSGDAVIENEEYWITLTAVYVDKENRTPTHVTWYKNDGSGEFYHTDDNYSINQPIAIYGTVENQEIPTREGYTFLGWAKDNEYEDDSANLRTSTSKTTADFLEYKNNKYYIAGTNIEVTQVAADEVRPYEALYAIWDVFYIYHSATGEIEECKVPANGGTFNLTAEVTDGCLYGGYWDYDAEADDHKGTIGTVSGLSAFIPESGKTYYLKEVSPNCLLPQIYVTYANRPGVTKVLTHMYLLTDVDDQHYEKFGVAVDNKDHEFSATVAKTLRITQGNGYKDNSVKDLFNVEIEGGGYLGFADASEYIGQSYKDQRIELVAYYETHDHVKVTGVKKRIVALGDLTFQDWSAPGIRTARTTVPSTLSDVVSTSVTTNGLMSKARLVINDVQEENAFTITKVDGGKKISQEVEPGNNTGKIAYAGKTNYVFAGWYADAAYEKVADFADVNSDMTVYAKYVKASNIKLYFTKKAAKSGNVTLKATLKITGEPNITDAAVVCGIQDNSYPVAFAGVKTTKSGKTTVDTYTGTVELEGLANNATFSAAISYKTPDGSVVNMGDKACKYSSGLVTVK